MLAGELVFDSHLIEKFLTRKRHNLAVFTVLKRGTYLQNLTSIYWMEMSTGGCGGAP